MNEISDLSNIPFAGGSAGDNLEFKKTFVFANGKIHSNAAVLALIRPKIRFGIIKTQSFRSLNKKLTVTKADMAKCEVIEFNNISAAEAYADAMGISADALENRFMYHPVGVMAEGAPFVRSPRHILPGGSINFYCSMAEGMELTLLEAADIAADTRKAIEKKQKTLKGISGIVNFRCLLRTMELEMRGQTESYGRIFSDIPTIGFSTYGEQYLGYMNQTSTMIVFV